jgi:hypothetical protein
MRLVFFLAGLLALAHSVPLLAEPLLTPHTAEYKVKISVISGKLNTELRKTENGYIANHVVRPTGIARIITRGTMDVTSEFNVQPGGMKPVRFQSVDTIRDEPDVDLRFDWDTNEAIGTVGADNVRLQLDGMAYDSISIQYELMHDLIKGDPSDQYTLFDVDRMQVANVSNIGEKTVETKAGKFVAVGIRHQKEGSDRTTTLWCVEELDYLPVIIEQHRDGKVNFRAKLVTYTPTSQKESTTALSAATPR